eukprot:CAMPEP_0114544080 /NCGR_PEP_ID=MMETSP0114-20121206/2689_1 /TAXON_ID=31324 /ORGANISM="Goniomonas sp, Strain m" /LENGTH=243 /DNA_ID=CAMNT_0001728443 /DNA_START=79 /DNA_END=807 /DNA_ORIENTATION=-
MHVSPRTLSLTQAISGSAFGCFLLPHLANHWSFHLGLATNSRILSLFRLGYQNRFVEPALFTSLGVHMGAGLLRVWQRVQNKDVDIKQVLQWVSKEIRLVLSLDVLALHKWSGYYLTLFTVAHAYFSRAPPLAHAESPIDSTYVTLTMQLWPYLFTPYYGLLAAAGSVHFVTGSTKASKILFPRASLLRPVLRPPVTRRLALCFAALSVSSVLAMGGFYFGVHVERWDEYVEVIRPHIPTVAW